METIPKEWMTQTIRMESPSRTKKIPGEKEKVHVGATQCSGGSWKREANEHRKTQGHNDSQLGTLFWTENLTAKCQIEA